MVGDQVHGDDHRGAIAALPAMEIDDAVLGSVSVGSLNCATEQGAGIARSNGRLVTVRDRQVSDQENGEARYNAKASGQSSPPPWLSRVYYSNREGVSMP